MPKTEEEVKALLHRESPRFIKKCIAQAEFLLQTNPGKYKTKWDAIEDSYKTFKEFSSE